jgi:hypothetical protein
MSLNNDTNHNIENGHDGLHHRADTTAHKADASLQSLEEQTHGEGDAPLQEKS